MRTNKDRSKTINWTAILYDKKDKEIYRIDYENRTEDEAAREAMSYIENHQHLNINDWSLTPTIK